MRMQASGVIRRYTVEIAAPCALTAVLMLRLVRTPAPAVVSRIVACPEVFRCSSLSGDIDLLVVVAADDIAHVNRVRDWIASIPSCPRSSRDVGSRPACAGPSLAERTDVTEVDQVLRSSGGALRALEALEREHEHLGAADLELTRRSIDVLVRAETRHLSQ